MEKLICQTMLIYNKQFPHLQKPQNNNMKYLNCYAYFTKTFVHPNVTKHITIYQAKGLK